MRRRNLRVMTDTEVQRILFEGPVLAMAWRAAEIIGA